MNLDDPVATALLVADALNGAGERYALYGGLLLAAYGEPRETHDVDVAVVDLTADAARRALESAGIQSAVSFEHTRFGGLNISRIVLLGGDEHTGLNALDLIHPRSPRYCAAAMDRAVIAPLRDRQIHALTADDFVIFKALATRDRDLDDAASVLERSQELLDVAFIDAEVAALSDEIADWDVRERWASIRARASQR